MLAGCGGGSEPTPVGVIRGSDYHFSAPSEWDVTRDRRTLEVSKGIEVLFVTRYSLVRAFTPALWPRVVSEFDGVVAKIARQQHGSVESSKTVTVAGRTSRSYVVHYEHDGKQLVERITFVLRGKTEYYLLCRYEGGDTEACDRLLATFTLD